jgi:hypothetical protein
MDRVMAENSDDVLLRRARRGDADAFAALFDRHAQRIFGFQSSDAEATNGRTTE